MKANKNSSVKGSALVLVIISMVVLLITGVGLLAVGYGSRLTAIKDNAAISAYAAADAGMSYGIWYLNKLKSDGVLAAVYNNFTVPDAPAMPTDTGQTYTCIIDGNWPAYNITSTGTRNGVERKVYAATDAEGIFDKAILAKSIMALGTHFSAEGYKDGVVDDTVSADIALLSSTGKISGSGAVDGTVYVGPGNTIENVDDRLVADSAAVLEETIPTPIIPAPTTPTGPGGDLKTEITPDISTSGRYNNIIFSNGAGGNSLKVSGDVILIIDANVGYANLNSGTITIAKDSSLTLYLGGNMTAKNGLDLDTSASGAKFSLYGISTTSQNIKLKNNGDIRGTIYAPNANFTVRNNLTMYGSIVANSFTAEKNVDMYYDLTVRNYAITDPAVTLKIRNWHE